MSCGRKWLRFWRGKNGRSAAIAGTTAAGQRPADGGGNARNAACRRHVDGIKGEGRPDSSSSDTGIIRTAARLFEQNHEKSLRRNLAIVIRYSKGVQPTSDGILPLLPVVQVCPSRMDFFHQTLPT